VEIIDSQIHARAPWSDWGDVPDKRNALDTELSLAAMDAVGIGAACISASDDWAEFAGAHFPDRFCSITSGLDPEAPDLDERLATVRQRPGVVGIRLVFTWPPQTGRVARFKAGGYDRLLAAAEKYEVPTAVFVSGEPSLAATIAASYPRLPLIVDHLGLGQPPIQGPDDPDRPFVNLPDLLALARFPNVAVKFSGAPTLSRERYPYPDLWPHLHKVIAAFRPERLMWGSDITRVEGRIGGHGRDAVPRGADYVGKHTYAEAVGFLRDTTELSERDKTMILGEAFRAWFRWPHATHGDH
jgi:predicted TIM-barrel fold metal-dependent hydrolase